MQQHVKPSLYFWTVGKYKETAGLRGCSSNIHFIARSYDDVSLSGTFCLYKSWLVLLHILWLPSLSPPTLQAQGQGGGGDQAVKSPKSQWRREPSRLRVWSASSPHQSAASFWSTRWFLVSCDAHSHETKRPQHVSKCRPPLQPMASSGWGF